MYGILGEDPSDAETLKVIVRAIAENSSIPIKTKGYGSCGELLRKAEKDLRSFARLGCTKYIICSDADRDDPKVRKARLTTIVRNSGVEPACVVIPVEELEAWILADIQSLHKIFSGWTPDEVMNPEAVESPKEKLEKLSRHSNRRPRYSHATHNRAAAACLDLDKVAAKCPSFRPLRDFVLIHK